MSRRLLSCVGRRSQIDSGEAEIVDYLNLALRKWKSPDRDGITRSDYQWTQIGWEGKDGNVLSAGPVGRVIEGAESAFDFVCAFRLYEQIVGKGDIQAWVFDIKSEDPSRSVSINIGLFRGPNAFIKFRGCLRHRPPPITHGDDLPPFSAR